MIGSEELWSVILPMIHFKDVYLRIMEFTSSFEQVVHHTLLLSAHTETLYSQHVYKQEMFVSSVYSYIAGLRSDVYGRW